MTLVYNSDKCISKRNTGISVHMQGEERLNIYDKQRNLEYIVGRAAWWQHWASSTLVYVGILIISEVCGVMHHTADRPHPSQICVPAIPIVRERE